MGPNPTCWSMKEGRKEGKKLKNGWQFLRNENSYWWKDQRQGKKKKAPPFWNKIKLKRLKNGNRTEESIQGKYYARETLDTHTLFYLVPSHVKEHGADQEPVLVQIQRKVRSHHSEGRALEDDAGVQETAATKTREREIGKRGAKLEMSENKW